MLKKRWYRLILPMTRAEQTLWARMNAKPIGWRFTRQHPIPPRFADFACVAAKVAVEILGKDEEETDLAGRDKFPGCQLLRFLERKILEDVEGCFQAISDACVAAIRIPKSMEAPFALHLAIRFDPIAVTEHVERHHPFCPPAAREAIIDRVCGRPWKETTLGAAVGICASTYVRHCMTDYDRQLRNGVLRDQALKAVRAEVLRIIESWQRGDGGVSDAFPSPTRRRSRLIC